MKEFVSIQYLRGLAAMLVVVFHLGMPLDRMGYGGHWPAGLAAGVDMFFVISGFVMWMTTRSREITPLAFWRKRIARIVPLYWLVTTVMVMVLLIAPWAVQTSRLQVGHVIASYLFVPALNPGKPEMQPLVFPGWTLNYEAFFYAIFGGFLLARPMIRLGGTVAVLLALVALGALFEPPRLSIAGFYTDSIVLEFAFGLVLGEWVYRRDGRTLLPRFAGWLLLMLGLAGLLLPWAPAEVPWIGHFGIPAAMIVLGGLAIEADGGVREVPLFHRIGDASYSIYLTQLMSMSAFFVAWRKMGLDREPDLLVVFCILYVAVATIGGMLTYRLVEKPFIALFKARRDRRKVAVVTAKG